MWVYPDGVRVEKGEARGKSKLARVWMEGEFESMSRLSPKAKVFVPGIYIRPPPQPRIGFLDGGGFQLRFDTKDPEVEPTPKADRPFYSDDGGFPLPFERPRTPFLGCSMHEENLNPPVCELNER